MRKLEGDIGEQMHFLKEQMKTKLSSKELQDSEEKLQVLLDKIVANLNKRFMEKQDVKAALKSFESQIQTILEMVVTKVDEFEVNEAMLTKRPLGFSCASCQKNLVNLSAHTQCLADYQVS